MGTLTRTVAIVFLTIGFPLRLSLILFISSSLYLPLISKPQVLCLKSLIHLESMNSVSFLLACSCGCPVPFVEEVVSFFLQCMLCHLCQIPGGCGCACGSGGLYLGSLFYWIDGFISGLHVFCCNGSLISLRSGWDAASIILGDLAVWGIVYFYMNVGIVFFWLCGGCSEKSRHLLVSLLSVYVCHCRDLSSWLGLLLDVVLLWGGALLMGFSTWFLLESLLLVCRKAIDFWVLFFCDLLVY